MEEAAARTSLVQTTFTLMPGGALELYPCLVTSACVLQVKWDHLKSHLCTPTLSSRWSWLCGELLFLLSVEVPFPLSSVAIFFPFSLKLSLW